jgi:hypothetical protein
MALLHGLLLVFSLITIAPLMIVFSMTIPTATVSDESTPEAPLPEIPRIRQYHRPKARLIASEPRPRPS